MKRERVQRERMKTWTQRGSHVGDGIRKPSTSAGMLTWCHKLDIKKGRATLSSKEFFFIHVLDLKFEHVEIKNMDSNKKMKYHPQGVLSAIGLGYTLDFILLLDGIAV